MSSYEFRLPDIGEGIAEAEIVAWHVKVGDYLEEDAPLADLMTDKATVEMTAPVSGRLTALAGAVGEQVAIGAVLAVLETEEAFSAVVHTPHTPVSTPVLEVQPQNPPHESGALKGEAHWEEEDRTGTASSPAEADHPVASLPIFTAAALHVHASPTVRQRAKELGVDLAGIVPAVSGRIRHADLDSYLLYHARGGYLPAGSARPNAEVKVIGLRRRIAENMAASKRHIPHFTYVEEFDVTKLEALRGDLNRERGDRARLTILPFLITAICRALPDFPMINARYDEEAGIVTRAGAVHLGIATQTDNGLMVPVLRNAESRNIWQLASEIARLSDATRSGKAKSDELSGSTLTITSLGALGGIATTPVINRPEVAIVGPNKIVERPVVVEGRIAIAKLMNVSISCDHRVVDGWDAASFVQAVKRLVENPAMLFVP
jgi:2-oxoisovalerate dehydrogenase E2 component (dihydrolipoyl transacylase)